MPTHMCHPMHYCIRGESVSDIFWSVQPSSASLRQRMGYISNDASVIPVIHKFYMGFHAVEI